MSEDWYREFGCKWRSAHRERVSVARRLFGIVPTAASASANAAANEIFQEDLRRAGVFKLTLHHAHMLMAGFKPEEIDQRGEITEEE